jgi:hypothetical protein
VRQLLSSGEMKHGARQFLVFIGSLVLASLPSFVNAAPPTDNLCERLHAKYLTKAQKALAEDKREEALRFLLEAQSVAKACANSSEKSYPQEKIRESGDALTSTLTSSVNSVTENNV